MAPSLAEWEEQRTNIEKLYRGQEDLSIEELAQEMAKRYSFHAK